MRKRCAQAKQVYETLRNKDKDAHKADSDLARQRLAADRGRMTTPPARATASSS